ncbi:hypothetical protein CTI12_AA347990 [Artemisia annua]|uniref:Transposase (Putative), gypsy type n=1 Tax=Artemisia annua TaxID=35608 RepID=A0A2U1MS08_ARTAN|nr:hypothetical protein CTI12_AA347990 [Artemisia annua]
MHDVATNEDIHDVSTDEDIHDAATDEDMHDVATDGALHDHDVEGDLNHGSYESGNDSGSGGSGESQFIDGVYYKPVRGSTDGDRLERDLLPLAPSPYYMSYPRDEGSSSHTPKCTEAEWDLVHHFNLGLLNKELFKDPEVCKTVIEKVPTPAEQYRMEGLSHRELDDRMTVLLCQLLTHGGAYKEAEDSHRDRGVKNKELKEKNAELIAKNAELKAEVRDLRRKLEKDIKKIRTGFTSFFRDDFEKLVRRFLESDEFSQAFASVINLGVSRGVERGLRMGRTETQFQEISRRISHFVPGAKKKLDDVMTAFPTQAFPFFDKVVQSAESDLQDISQLEPDKVVPPCKAPSTVVTSSSDPDTRTRDRPTTLPTKTFGYTSTPEHLKTKKASK